MVAAGLREAMTGMRLGEPEVFPVGEKVLLAAAIVASVGVFAWRLGPMARNVWGSKKDTDFSLRPVGKRVWKFFWEVLCQGKVIEQRPLPGLAHALVFWGFLAFALVTLNHVAVGFGVGFLAVCGRLRDVLCGVCGGVGAAGGGEHCGTVCAEICGEAAVAGGEGFGGVGGDCGADLRADGDVSGSAVCGGSKRAAKGLWWAHTLVLLAFLPIIPGTKHLHLVLSPLTVFLKRPEFSQLPKLEGDEDFGLVAGKDLTQMIALQAYSCVECGRCTEHCPAATTGKVLNPKEIVLGVRSYLNAEGPGSEVALLDGAQAALSMEAAFECTTCGACEFQCPVGVQHLPVLIGLRRGAVNTGAWEDRYGTKLFLALEKQGNSLGMSSAERDKFIAKQEFPIFDGSQEYCLWLGCMGSYDPKGREIVADFARVMRALGTQFGVLKKEKCTGDPARRLGNDLLFGDLAEQGLKAFASGGGEEDCDDLSALREDDGDGLAGVWRGAGD